MRYQRCRGCEVSRRYAGHMKGERYLGNVAKREVHDLDQEDPRPNGCQIDEIIRARNDRPFNSLSGASSVGFDSCAKCLEGSTR